MSFSIVFLKLFTFLKNYAHCSNATHKSLILRLKWINLDDLRMPHRGACVLPGAACVERGDGEAACVRLRAAFREDCSHAWGQTHVKWGVKPAELPGIRIVLINAAAVSYHECEPAVWGERAAWTEWSVPVCTFRGQLMGNCGHRGHMELLQEKDRHSMPNLPIGGVFTKRNPNNISVYAYYCALKCTEMIKTIN